jgi:TolB-like protein/tRNA A-37 threonylcarbamoyl transferase component Bud32/Tfp pilus assembly protein PilF
MAEVLDRLRSALADRYSIERELGSGGMATVYLARDPKHHRRVAVKVLRPELAAALGPERFLREIEVTAGLTHPHIVPLYDSGVASGLLFHVTPYVEGESLRERLRREKQLPIEDAISIAREVADAMDYAHRRGVVHRDIKPENILLEERHAVVADFGIARAIDAAGGARLTETGVAVGTPAYMSPEQAGGDDSVDGRSDLYSLGCVLYEMLAGEPPFTGPTVDSVIHQHLSLDPRQVTELRPAVDRNTCAVVTKALAKTPADRFRTAAEFAATLASGGEGGEPPTSVAERTASIAVLPFRDMSGDPENQYFSDGLTEDIIDALTHVPGLHVVARTSAFVFRGKEADAREIGARLNVEHILEGSVRKAGTRLRVTTQLVKASDGYHLWSQRFDREMTDVFAIQDEISQAIVEKLRLRLSPDRPLVRRYTENLVAYDLCLKARYHLLKMTQEGREAGRRYCEQAIELDPDYARAHVMLSESYLWSAFWGSTSPREAFSRAKSAALEALRLDDTIADAHSALGTVLACGDFEWHEAEREFQRALNLGPSAVAVRYDYAWCYAVWFLMPLGRLEQGIFEMRRALELDPLDPFYSSLLGYLLHVARKSDAAVAQLEHAVDLDPTFFFSHWLRSVVLAECGRIEEAIAAAQRADELSGGDAMTLGVLGWVYGRAGRIAEARQLLEDLTARRRLAYVSAFPLAMAHFGLGELDAGLEWIATGIEERDPSLVTILKTAWAYDPLRSHPLYQALLRKMNLESEGRMSPVVAPHAADGGDQPVGGETAAT